MLTDGTFSSLAVQVLLSLGVAMARALGMLAITPAFTRLGLATLTRSATAFAISLPLTLALVTSGALVHIGDPIFVTAILIKEVAIGLALGLAYGVPFWAAEIAGDYVDLQRGSTSGQLIDPSNFAESGITATLFTIASVTIFFVSGGFKAMLGEFYHSYELWPVASLLPVFNASTAVVALGMLDQIAYSAMVLAFPVIAATLLCDLVLAYLSRTAPQMHIFDMSLSIKAVVFSFVMLLYILYFTAYVGTMIPNSYQWIDHLLGSSKP